MIQYMDWSLNFNLGINLLLINIYNFYLNKCKYDIGNELNIWKSYRTRNSKKLKDLFYY